MEPPRVRGPSVMRRAARPLAYLAPPVIVAGLSQLHGSRLAEEPYDFVTTFRLPWAVSYATVLVLAAYGAGLPELPRTPRRALTSAAAAAGASALVVSALQLVVGDALLPRFVVFGTALVCLPWWVLCSALAQSGRSRDEERDRVVLVAEAAEVDAVRQELAGTPERPAVLVATLEPADVTQDVATWGLVEHSVTAAGATVVVLDRTAQESEAIVAQVAHLHEQGVRVRTLSMFYEQWLGKLPISELERISLLFDIGELHRARYVRLRRLIDLAFALIGLVLLVPVVPLVWLGNRLANRGPLFFSQERVGRRGTTFSILKFRTMEPGLEGAAWTTQRDPRVTPYGRVLRVTHLDELPQVVNILRGELSLVGPRPEQPLYVAGLAEKLPFYQLRHLVQPGLTGWAQVKYGYAASEQDAMEKLQYDFYYLRHQGMQLDLRIIGRTIRSVVEGGGR